MKPLLIKGKKYKILKINNIIFKFLYQRHPPLSLLRLQRERERENETNLGDFESLKPQLPFRVSICYFKHHCKISPLQILSWYLFEFSSAQVHHGSTECFCMLEFSVFDREKASSIPVWLWRKPEIKENFRVLGLEKWKWRSEFPSFWVFFWFDLICSICIPKFFERMGCMYKYLVPRWKRFWKISLV